MVITCDRGLAFIDESDVNDKKLLVFSDDDYLVSNSYFTRYDYHLSTPGTKTVWNFVAPIISKLIRPLVQCWQIKLDDINDLIYDIATIIIRARRFILIMSNGQIYIRGSCHKSDILNFDAWTMIHFIRRVDKIRECFGIIYVIDTDGKLWYWEKIFADFNQYILKAKLVKFNNIDFIINDINVQERKILLCDGSSYQYFENPNQRCIKLPHILLIDHYKNYYFLDTNEYLHFHDYLNSETKFIRNYDEIITHHCPTNYVLFLIADDELHYKKRDGRLTKFQLPRDSACIKMYRMSPNKISVCTTDGTIYFIDSNETSVNFFAMANTDYDFSTAPIRAVKSANKV